MKKPTHFDLPVVFLLTAFFAVGVIGLWYGLASLRESYYVVRNSLPAEGTVIGLTGRRGTWAHSVVEFRYPNGVRATVVSDTVTRSPTLGTRAEVLLHPKNQLAPRVYSVADFWVIPCFSLLFGVSFGGIAVTQFLVRLKQVVRMRA